MTASQIRVKRYVTSFLSGLPQNKAVILILSLSLFLKIILSRILTVHGDEGMYLYDASLILEGLHPHVDFHARSPVFLYFLSLFMFLFGKSVFVGRLVMCLVSTLTAVLIYRIGKSLFNETIALISLAVFSLSPFTLMWSVIIATEVLQLTLVTLSIYLVITFLREDRSAIWYLTAGLVLGLAIFVRRTSAIIFIAESIMILYYLLGHSTGDGSRIYGRSLFLSTTVRSSLILMGSFLIFLPIFLFIVSGTDLQYAIDSFLSNAGVGGSGKGDKFVVFQELIQRAYYLVFPMWLFLVVSVRGLLKADTPANRALGSPELVTVGIALFPLIVLTDTLILSVVVIILVLIFILRRSAPLLPWIEKGIDNSPNMFPPSGSPMMFGGLIIVLTILYSAASTISELQSVVFILFIFILLFILRSNTRFGKDHPSVLWLLLILSLPPALLFSPGFKDIVIFSVISLSILIIFDQVQTRSDLMKIDLQFPHIILLLWLLSILMFYLYYSMSQEIFMYELSAVASLIAGLIFYHIHKVADGRSLLTKAFFTLIIISFVTSSFYYVDFEKDTTITKPWTVDEVADYIRENTREDEEIFTANMAIAIEADRPIVMNLSHPTIYCKDYVQGFPDFSVINYPTPEGIVQYLEKNRVRYIVNDPLTNYYYLMFNDVLREYVMKNYVLVKEVNDVQILLRSREGDYRLTSSLTDGSLPFIEKKHSGEDGVLIGYRVGEVGQENIFYQTIAGSEVSPEHQVTPVSQSHSYQSHGLTDRQGNTYFVWSENTSTYSNIYFSKFSSDGAHLIEPFPITSNDEMGTYALTPIMIMDSMDRIFIFWSWASSSEGFYDLYYTVLDTDGTSLSGNVPITNDLANNFNPSVGIDGDDRIHLVWQDGQEGIYRIKYASYDFDNGSKLLVEHTPPRVISSIGESVNPDISLDGGRIDVVWENTLERYGHSIMTIRYVQLDLSGDIILPEQQMTFEYASAVEKENRMTVDARNPKVASSGEQIVIIWQDDRWEEISDLVFWNYHREREDVKVRYSNIHYKLLNENGIILKNDTRISYYESNSMDPDVAIAGDEIHIVWTDDITSTAQIYHKGFRY